MRPYTDKFVRNRLMTRLHLAACPFPGKYPLHLYARNGKDIYHGKFNAAIWKCFWKRRNLNYGDQVYLIFDKGGAVIWGTDLKGGSLHIESSQLCYRYFAATFLHPSYLLGVAPIRIGNYSMYLDDTDLSMLSRPLDRGRWLHYVNSNIAHVRTV